MAGFAFYALIGLLLLIPLEVFLLIMAALLISRRKSLPKAVLPSPGRRERYGWEDVLKFSPERKPSGGRKAVISVLVVLLLVVIVAVPGLFLVAPSLNLNLSRQPANDSVILPPSELNETPVRGIFSNLTLPRLNITVPDLNVSKVFAPLKTGIKVVALLMVVLAAFVVLFFIIRRRGMAVVTKARKTSEKLIENASVAKNGKEPPKVGGGSFLMLGTFKNYLVPALIFFLLLVIAVLFYILRGRIRNEFSGKLLSFAVSAKEFALNYRLYILAGVVVLAISVLLLRLVARRRQRPA